jgi:glycosyltransferase involved in cell wall biosynthesis
MARHILMCCNFYPPFFIGGAELIVHAQARKMIQAGHRVTVFCGRDDGSYEQYSIAEEIYEDVPVIRLYLQPDNFTLGHNFHNPQVDRQFGAVLDRLQPDIVHFHNIMGLSLGMISQSAQRGIPAYVTFQDHWGFCFKNTRLKTAQEVCQDFSQCADCGANLTGREGRFDHVWLRNDYLSLQFSKLHRMIYPSRYLSTAYAQAGIPEVQTAVISQGMDVDRFSTLQTARLNRSYSQPVTFTFIGYLGFHKGMPILLESLEVLREKGILGTVCRFNIVGEGEWGVQLKNFVSRYQLENVIKLWGKVGHGAVEQIYEQTDILLNCSVWPENQPVTIMEAMSAGIPVMASALGGNLDLIKDRETGLLYETGNAEALTNAILEISHNPQMLKAWGEAAYESMRENTRDRYVENILELYRQPKIEAAWGDRMGDDRIVACGGEVFSTMAIESFDCWPVETLAERQDRPRFVRASWLDPGDWDRVDILWVVEDGVDRQVIRSALRRGIALVVPASQVDLVAICRQGQCGVFYETPEEAQGCLAYLRGRSEILEILGRNAQLAANLIA